MIFLFCLFTLATICAISLAIKNGVIVRNISMVLIGFNFSSAIIAASNIPNWIRAKTVASVINEEESKSYTTWEVYNYMYSPKGDDSKNRDRLLEMFDRISKRKDDVYKHLDVSVEKVLVPIYEGKSENL